MSSAIYDEIEKYWVELYANAQRKAPARSEFRDLHEQLERDSRQKAAEGLQPWLGILEFGLEWLATIHFALNNENEIGPKQKDFRVTWALVGSACAFGFSLRDLCLAGFDTPARALLRSYTEALFLCAASLHDKSLAAEYEKADDDLKVKNFWHTTASPKNLHSRINEIEKKMGFPDALIQELTSWRKTEYEVLAQSAHLSYLAACMTCLPAIISEDDKFQVGILGRASGNSIRTISYAARTTWYFSRLVSDALIGNDKNDDSLLTLDKENDMHQKIIIGRDVLSRITVAHWDE